MTIKKHDNSAIDLSEVSFGDYSPEYSFEGGDCQRRAAQRE